MQTQRLCACVSLLRDARYFSRCGVQSRHLSRYVALAAHTLKGACIVQEDWYRGTSLREGCVPCWRQTQPWMRPCPRWGQPSLLQIQPCLPPVCCAETQRQSTSIKQQGIRFRKHQSVNRYDSGTRGKIRQLLHTTQALRGSHKTHTMQG